MMTKTQFAKYIVEQQRCILEIDDSVKDSELESYMMQSSSLCVALEHLGLIKSRSLQKYASTRGGVIFTYRKYDKETMDEPEIALLSVREILNLLPD